MSRQINVVLINPPNTDRESYIARSADRWPHRVKRGKLFSNKLFPKYPLYLMYSAALLEKQGFNVIVIDAAERDFDNQTTIDLVKKITPRPILIGIETASPSLDNDMLFVCLLQESVPAHICLFGPHATVYHNEILKKYPFVDSVVRGEHFLPLADLANSVKGQTSLSLVKGLSYRSADKVMINPEAHLLDDLDALPMPARHLLDPHRYLMGHYTYKPQLLMVTSMGCPHRCIFCLWNKVLYAGKVRMRAPSKVVEEMFLLKDKYGAREIYFDDDCFNITVKRVFDVCEEIIKSKIKIPWITEMTCSNTTCDMLKIMKKAGCIKILYGVESGNQEILNESKKNITIEQIENAFKMTRKAGIKSHATFMFGLPGETKETITQTMKLARRLNPDTIQCSIALPYPGTEFYEMAKTNGTLSVDNWIDFDGELCGVIKYPGLTKEIIRDSVGQMYRQYYIRPRYIISRVLAVRSFSDVMRFINLAMGYFRRFSN